jgi:hypothetical protein
MLTANGRWCSHRHLIRCDRAILFHPAVNYKYTLVCSLAGCKRLAKVCVPLYIYSEQGALPRRESTLVKFA